MIPVIVFAGILNCITGFSSTTTCYNGWLAFEGSRYYFGPDNVHFKEAEHYCRQHRNSHLIHVDNKLENDFIKERLRAFKPSEWWLGLTDELIEDSWQWLDDDKIANYTDWYPGQPDDASDDCAIFYNTLYFKWADVSCTSNHRAICELTGVNVHGQTEIFG